MKYKFYSDKEWAIMKKFLITYILIIIGIIFISGCTEENKPKSYIPKDILINQESGNQTPDLIIKQNDVSGFTLVEYYFMAISNNSAYTFSGHESGRATGMKNYIGSLPTGTRNVGQFSYWADKSGQEVRVLLIKYDSNSGFERTFVPTLDNYKRNTEKLKDIGVEVDDPDIGDYSFYYNEIEKGNIRLYFTHQNYYAEIEVADEKKNNLNESIRIATIIKDRLDENTESYDRY